MNHHDFKRELLKNPEVRREFERFDLRWELEKLWTRFVIWLRSL